MDDEPLLRLFQYSQLRANPPTKKDMMCPNHLTIKLKFLKWLPLYVTEKPFQIFLNIPPEAKDQRTTNLVYEDVSLSVQDIRLLSSAEQLSLDDSGFMYCNHMTTMTDFSNREVVERTYLPEVEELLRTQIGDVERVFFFDWRVSLTIFHRRFGSRQ